MPNIINTSGHSSDFNSTRLLGSILVEGAPRDIAENRTALIKDVVLSANVVSLTTDDIRFLRDTTLFENDVDRIRVALTSRLELQSSRASARGAMPKEALVSIAEMLQPIMAANDPPTVSQAIELVRVVNSAEAWGLTGENGVLTEFVDQFHFEFLERCVGVLKAELTRGLGYYSKEHDITVGGGFINSNSLYRGVTKASRVGSTPPVVGLTLDVTYTVTDCDCDGLEAIQVFFGTRRIDGKKVGDKEITVGGKTYDCFVDGGKNSPGGEVTAGKPYYVGVPPVEAGHVDDCKSVRVFDRPTAILAHQEGYFETAIICINYKKSGKDKVLKVFKWGWKNRGKDYTTSPGPGGKNTGIEESDEVSGPFKDVLAHDYPGYELA